MRVGHRLGLWWHKQGQQSVWATRPRAVTGGMIEDRVAHDLVDGGATRTDDSSGSSGPTRRSRETRRRTLHAAQTSCGTSLHSINKHPGDQPLTLMLAAIIKIADRTWRKDLFGQFRIGSDL